MTTIMLWGFTACSEEAAITPKEEVSYADLKAKVDLFDKVYVYYAYEHPDELRVNNGEDYTPLGNPCSYSYVANIEGVNQADAIKSCTITATDDQGNTSIYDYYAIDVSVMFVSRTCLDSDNILQSCDKYIFQGKDVYKIDEDEQMMTPVDKPDTLDMFMNFSDIEERYGKA